MLRCNLDTCTGCSACAQICPTSCISMEENVEGFLYPVVSAPGCIECGRCTAVCPSDRSMTEPERQTAYAAINTSHDEREKGTSGGAFSAIAQYVNEQGGTVYGCAYTSDLVAKHIRTTGMDELVQLNGSKYVQSDSTDIYKAVRDDLANGKMVLFSGTPCQVAGLYSFLGRKPENLITVDLVCHGVPSPGYFRKFVKWMSECEKGKITDVNFRDKRNKGWSLAGTYLLQGPGNKERRKKLFNFSSYYYAYFLSGDLYRKSCYACPYANMKRLADFTLGDLWGAEGLKLNFSISEGCSLVLTNTDKAAKLIQNLKLEYLEIPKEFAVKTNRQLSCPPEHSALREVIYNEYVTCEAGEIQKRYRQRRKKQIILGRIKYLVPNVIKRAMLAFKYRNMQN